MASCLGIFRELQNSPNRANDDALILQAVMEQLELLKVRTTLMTPEQADRDDLEGFDLIVPMCEAYPRITRLQDHQKATGQLMINPAASVLRCYRVAMLEAFSHVPQLRVPATRVRRTSDAANAAAPDFEAPQGWWLKRGDVHNTCAHDVVFARDWSAVEAVRREFERREIAWMAVQQHIDGDLIKFYGVGPGQWFTWFYHDPASARKLTFELEELARQAELAARAVELEVFGGDAIISSDGHIYIIDINSWPSFSRVRADASVQIARRLKARLQTAAANKS